MYQWQQKQKELQLTDESISQNVQRRIKKFHKAIVDQQQVNEAISGAEAELQAQKQGSHRYKQVQKNLDELKEAKAEVDAYLQDLDETIAADMERLHRNKDYYKTMAERSKLPNAQAKKQTQPVTDAPPAPEAPEAPVAGESITPPETDAPDKPTQHTTTETKASVQMMITADMRARLQSLGYADAGIDTMKPGDAAKLLAAGTPKPATAAAPPKPHTTAPPADQPPVGPKKKNSPLVAVGVFFALIGGIMVGRGLK